VKTNLIEFESEAEWLAARHRDITSTEVAALFGLSPYHTAFDLAVQKQLEQAPTLQDSDRIRWGRRLQDTIAQGVADDKAWKIAAMDLTYARHPSVKLGASFDYLIDGDNPGVLEIKNVDSLIFLKDWEENEAPAHIELQLQTQLELMDVSWGCIAAFVGGNRLEYRHRERDLEVGARIIAKASEFWELLDAGKLPDPLMPEDAATLISLYQYAEAGKVYDGLRDSELHEYCMQYASAAQAEKFASEEKEVAKARILERIGSAEKALGSGFRVSAGMVPETPVQYVRKAYRSFRVTEKK
jgi:putative phage-type endonuclease